MEIVAFLKILQWIKDNWKAIVVVVALAGVLLFVNWALRTSQTLKVVTLELKQAQAALAKEKEAAKVASIIAQTYNAMIVSDQKKKQDLERKIADAMRKRDVAAWADTPIPADYRCARWGECGVLQTSDTGPPEVGY